MLSSAQEKLTKRVVYTDGKMEYTTQSCGCEDVKFCKHFLRGTPEHGRIRRLNFKSRKTQHFQDHMLKFI